MTFVLAVLVAGVVGYLAPAPVTIVLIGLLLLTAITCGVTIFLPGTYADAVVGLVFWIIMLVVLAVAAAAGGVMKEVRGRKVPAEVIDGGQP